MSTTYTSEDGAFEFSVLPNGDYVIQVKVKDYEPLQQTVEIMNGARRGISLFLSKPLIPATSNLNLAISAHQLSAPHKAEDEFEKGMTLLYDKSQYRPAIAQFEHAIRDFPNFYEAYVQIGAAYQNLGQLPAAEEAFRKSVDLSSGQYAEPLFLLSALLSDNSRYEEAATFARKSTAADASSWRGPFQLARALTGLKQFDEAEKFAIQSRDRNPDNAAAYLVLANIHIGRHDYPSLAKDLDGYLKIAPHGSEADRVRKAREQVQATLKQDEDASSDDDADQADPAEPDSGRPTSPSAAPRKARSPAPADPDSSGLPPLPRFYATANDTLRDIRQGLKKM